MRTMKPLFLCAILLVSFLPIANVSATSEEVCCDSTTVELYLLGPASSGELSPFEAELSDESEEKKISDAIAQQEEIGSWEINPSWPGSYPSSTWEFSIDYEVANAGGAQINASVEVEIGGDTYTGITDQSNSFLAAGSGQLTINVNVDAGSIPSSTAVTVTLSAQTVVFSVPGTDAGLTFSWGGVGDESSVTADLPIVSLRLDEPITDGMEVYLSMIVASPFGQMTAAHANTLELRVNGGMVSGDPIVTSSGDFVRLTWTWIATTSGEQTISVEASIQIQSGTPIQSGTATFTIEPFDDGNDGGGGGFYPTEEPLRSNGAGSHLIMNMEMKLDTTDGYLTLERNIDMVIDGELAYWMRWGMDNIGNEDPGLSLPLRIFNSGMISEEDRRNRVIDNVEKNEFENQMVNLAPTYMNDGMAIELEELIGSNIQDLERISFNVDLQGQEKVTPHPITLSISTLEIVKSDEKKVLFRNFVSVQPTPIWASYDMSVSIETGMMASLTGATIKGEDSIEFSKRRTPFGESIDISAENLKPAATFYFEGMPSEGYLNAPLSLSVITAILIIAGIYSSLQLTSNKRRGALWIEMALIPAILLALFLGYPPYTVGVITGISIAIWIITAVASPRRKGLAAAVNQPIFPVIECPACSTPNPITTDERPFRLPCSGCGRVLKIVD